MPAPDDRLEGAAEEDEDEDDDEDAEEAPPVTLGRRFAAAEAAEDTDDLRRPADPTPDEVGAGEGAGAGAGAGADDGVATSPSSSTEAAAAVAALLSSPPLSLLDEDAPALMPLARFAVGCTERPALTGVFAAAAGVVGTGAGDGETTSACGVESRRTLSTLRRRAAVSAASFFFASSVPALSLSSFAAAMAVVVVAAVVVESTMLADPRRELVLVGLDGLAAGEVGAFMVSIRGFVSRLPLGALAWGDAGDVFVGDEGVCFVMMLAAEDEDEEEEEGERDTGVEACRTDDDVASTSRMSFFGDVGEAGEVVDEEARFEARVAFCSGGGVLTDTNCASADPAKLDDSGSDTNKVDPSLESSPTALDLRSGK